MIVEVLEKVVNFSEADKEIFVSAEAALLYDPVVALPVFKTPSPFASAILTAFSVSFPMLLISVLIPFSNAVLQLLWSM